jgi:hypothetical protein
MYEATARSGPNAPSAGALALTMSCAQQFVAARDATVSQRAGCNLSSTRLEEVVRRT